MSKFKVGDLVVPNLDNEFHPSQHNDRVYTVVKAYEDQVDLDKEFVPGNPLWGWWEERFKLAKNHIVTQILNDL